MLSRGARASHAAAIADRILFLADGCIVRDMPHSEPGVVIAAMDELTQD